MLKLHAGVSKKVGLTGSSSASASRTIEAELDGTKKSTHIGVQSKAATTSSNSHELRKHSRKHVVVRNAANHRSPLQTILVGDEGLEPPTPSV